MVEEVASKLVVSGVDRWQDKYRGNIAIDVVVIDVAR